MCSDGLTGFFSSMQMKVYICVTFEHPILDLSLSKIILCDDYFAGQRDCFTNHSLPQNRKCNRARIFKYTPTHSPTHKQNHPSQQHVTTHSPFAHMRNRFLSTCPKYSRIQNRNFDAVSNYSNIIMLTLYTHYYIVVINEIEWKHVKI